MIDLSEVQGAPNGIPQPSIVDLRDFVENAVVGMFRTTPEGRYIIANPALARMYGFNSVTALVSDLTDIATQLYVDPTRRAAFQALLRDSDAVHDFESEIRRRDGTTLWISENARAVRDKAGRVMYYEGTVTDVTDKRRAEAAGEAKSNFLAHMSHELRTPLNAIMGFADAIRCEVFGPIGNQTYGQYIGAILQASSHLLELINEILDLAKVEAGKLELQEEDLDPVALCTACLTLVRPKARQKGVRLKVRTGSNQPTVLVDAIRLKQILLNLLSNAVKFTPDGGEIVVSMGTDAEGWFEIAVSDNGIGIAGEDLPRVIEPFSQARNATVAGQEGTGLGLALVKRLVDLHRGLFDLESELGRGTIARVRLPPDRVKAVRKKKS